MASIILLLNIINETTNLISGPLIFILLFWDEEFIISKIIKMGPAVLELCGFINPLLTRT